MTEKINWVRRYEAIQFILDEMAQDIHTTQTNKGFYELDQELEELAGAGHLSDKILCQLKVALMGTRIALMHSELSEALESIRKKSDPFMSEHIPEFLGIEEELADTIIRILDLAGTYKLRVGQAILAKLIYNDTREHKHGGKQI